MNFWFTRDPWLRQDGTTRLRPDLAERVGRGDHVLSVIGGNAHTVLGVVEHPQPFDFVLPGNPELPTDESREFVPADAVRARLSEIANPYLATLPAVIAVAPRRVLQLQPPPPSADESLLERTTPWSRFPDRPRKLAPKWLRYKLWRLHGDIIRAACATLGIGYVPAPSEAMDADGFLAPEYDDDGHHANAAYGALVLDILRKAA